MAKKARPRHVQQWDELDLPSAQSAEGAGPMIRELMPDAPAQGLFAAQAVEAVPSADTVVPHADFFAARDALEAQLGGMQAVISATGDPVNDGVGRGNILGLGVGFRTSSLSMTGDVAVKVFVREKLPLGSVDPSAEIPSDVDGMPTDVEAIGDVMPFSYARRYDRPVPLGVSTSHVRLPGSGTLGCLVVLDNHKLCVISNNHVFANENSAQVGDEIIQPGNAEPFPAPDQLIGRLERFVPIQATGNKVDAAAAWTTFSRVSRRHVTYQISATPAQAQLGMTVLKNGRTTQSTLGAVTALGVNISVRYRPFPAGAEMRDQIAIRGLQGPFSRAGDSGSIIVTANTKQPVALLFAGNSDSSITFGNRIENVIQALGIESFVPGA